MKWQYFITVQISASVIIVIISLVEMLVFVAALLISLSITILYFRKKIRNITTSSGPSTADLSSRPQPLMNDNVCYGHSGLEIPLKDNSAYSVSQVERELSVKEGDQSSTDVYEVIDNN